MLLGAAYPLWMTDHVTYQSLKGHGANQRVQKAFCIIFEENQMTFFADIRLACKFSINQNLVNYIAEERELDLSETEITEATHKIEETILGLLYRGKHVSIFDVIYDVLNDF